MLPPTMRYLVPLLAAATVAAATVVPGETENAPGALAQGAQEVNAQPPPAADPIITAPVPESGEVPAAEFMAQVYAVSEQGARLYGERRYAEALPYLAAAAQRGFKIAQAAIADIVLHGRGGVPRNVQAGIGWLGAAAQPQTSSRIAHYYQQVLGQLPGDRAALAERVVARYRAQYGGGEHRVACRLFGEVVEELRCGFVDDADFASRTNVGGEYVEEMVVTAPRITAPEPEFGEMPSGAFIFQVYDAANRGAQRYKEKRYKEALPLLVIAAKRGFKWAQASAADIYLHGRGGVPRDLETGIGWLGVAAQQKTANAIVRYFKETAALLPERFTDEAVAHIVADYRERYGNARHRVACRFSADEGRSWSFYRKSLRCHFIDEATQCRNISILGDEIESQWTCAPVEGTRAIDIRPY